MASFVKLTDIANPETPQPIWVNLDRVQALQRRAAHAESSFGPAMPEYTCIWFHAGGETQDAWDEECVLETPEEILWSAPKSQTPGEWKSSVLAALGGGRVTPEITLDHPMDRS